jgi:UDP-3-O-[3-hydroxymyristoyl] glucosamine N-acyltransferase
MSIKIKDILNYLSNMGLEHKYQGDNQLTISNFCPINNLKDNSITWIKNVNTFENYNFNNIHNILIVSKEILNAEDHNKNINFIFCNNPKEVFFSILKEFFKQEEYKNCISSSSVVETKSIGENVYIGHNCYISKNVIIDDNVVIKNNVSIEGKVIIGQSTIIHSGVVIGTDGFGYFQNSGGKNIKVPHYGGVMIGNDVEIGANACIDKGTLDDTIIGDNVKIDNLCHISHNVVIKDNTLMAGKANIGGSSIIGSNSWIGLSAIISNGLSIGDNCHIGLGSVVISNVADNVKVFGNPARVYDKNK